ncbi:MAG: hypothetical protein WB471_12100 [Nocardioides sp.]
MVPIEPVSRLSAVVTAALVVLAGLVVLGLGATAIGTEAQDHAGGSTPPDGPLDAVASPTSRAREVIREWDRLREEAWRGADARALRSLYLPDAIAGRRDVALLRRWTDRGALVTRLQPQVLALHVLRASPRRLVVQVIDRLGILTASVAGESVVLPRDRPAMRRIDLRRGPRPPSRWRVAEVRGLGFPGTLGE